MMEAQDSAVQLLKEWKTAKSDLNARRTAKAVYGHTIEEMQWSDILPEEKCEGILVDIPRRLDEMAEGAGIKLHTDGMVSFTKFGDKTDSMVCPRVYGHELHALLEWLLMKQNTVAFV